MALVAVLWIVAALSIMVTGAAHTVQQQIRATSSQRDQLAGQAIGEAAIALALQEMQVLIAQGERVREPVQLSVAYGGANVSIDVSPLDGLIALNGATHEMLAALLEFAGELPPDRARVLAESMIQWRDGVPELDFSADPQARQARRFEAPEDLLLVPGVDYDLYRKLVPLISTDLGQAGRVNLLAAPIPVLLVLSSGNQNLVNQYMGQRASGNPSRSVAGFPGAIAGGTNTTFYRLNAEVPLDGGTILALTQDVALGPSYSWVAPWRVLGTKRRLHSR